jgi:HAD superfamily hydrolase (TIGR01450 family)
VPEPLKLALVTDIHNGKESLTKKGGMAIPLLRQFASFVETEAPDLIVELGDRISDVDSDTDRISLSAVAAVFAAVAVPRRHLMGNHDRVYLSEADNRAALGQDFRSHSIDIKGWHLAFWQADVHLSHRHSPCLTAADLAWLQADLAATNLPTIVFSHIPLDGASMTGNFYFEANPQYATYANVDAAQRIISEAGNVAMCVAGHVHWNNISRIDGVPYVTLQSLTESATTQGDAAAGWAIIEADHQLRWRGYGGDPIELTVNLGGGNRRWTRPLPPFRQLVRERAPQINDLRDRRGLLLDLDGVVYRGDKPITGAIDFLNDILASGRQVIAITNNAQASAADYCRKLAALGLVLDKQNIVTSGQALGRYLCDEKPQPGVFIAGSAALRADLLAAGAVESDRPDYVVAGIADDLQISTLTQAVLHLNNGAKLVASNGDRTIPTAAGLAPEAGAVVAFLEAASSQKAYIAGKPNSVIFDLALARIDLSAAEVVMIGDTYDTDILGANNAGIAAIYVESGNPPDLNSNAIPDLTIADIAGLRSLFGI